MTIRVLIACEESQVVCKEFLKLGFDAYSCDIQPCSGHIPSRHIQGDVKDLLRDDKDWDLIIAHPPCTYLCVAGNRWMVNNLERQQAREEALDFVRYFMELDVPHLAIENPIGVISTRIRKPDQIIEPWMFGESYCKKTCLWLKGLPKLTPTKIVDKGEIHVTKGGIKIPQWYSNAWGLPKDERQRVRSKTFKGIAQAMAEQWGGYLKDGK